MIGDFDNVLTADGKEVSRQSVELEPFSSKYVGLALPGKGTYRIHMDNNCRADFGTRPMVADVGTDT